MSASGRIATNSVQRKSKRLLARALEPLEARRFFAAHIAGDPTVYATIQAAVDAALPNAIVTVDSGTYAEQVALTKPLTIRGAQAGVDARSNVRISGAAAETTLIGITDAQGNRTSSFYIDSDNVIVDGVVVQNQTSQGQTGAGVVVAPRRSGTHLLNSILQNNVSGLFLANYDPANPAIVQHNLFRNNNNPGLDGGHGIFTNGEISGGTLSDVFIDANTFINNRGGVGTGTYESAVAFQALTVGSQANITITNNVFDSNGKAVLFFNTSGILIQNNFATNTLDQYSGTLRFEGNNQNVQILSNTIYANTGPAVAVDSKAVPGNNSGFVVNGNNFFGNSLAYGSKISVVFDNTSYLGQPDVRNNWWGSATGPGGDGAGSGDKVYGIGHVVTGGQWSVAAGGNELFSPWSSTPNLPNSAPYWGAGASSGALIQVEDFDHGGEGVAYHDVDSANLGGVKYRGGQGVDLQNTTDAGGGLNLGYAKVGEWLNYSLNLPVAGTFNLDVRVANTTSSGTFHVEIDGVNVTGAMIVPNTGGYQIWRTITKSGIPLSGGAHGMRLVLDAAPNGSIGNFNWLKLTNVAPAVPPPVAPNNLLASALSSTQVGLSWQDNSGDESGFVIERKAGADGAWQTLVTTAANITSFIDNTAAGWTTYTYRVRATGPGGDSANSNESAVTTPYPPIVTYLSDLPWVSAVGGYGPVEKDMSNGDLAAGDGGAITLNGVVYPKGLGTHAYSEIIYNLAGGGYTNFASDVGVDDRQTTYGSVVFQVFLDGVKVFDSGIMGPLSATQSINLDLIGKSELKLIVTDAGDGDAYDHADWAGARMTKPGTPPPPLPAPSAPTGLAASAASSTQINLIWTDATGETAYRIERSIDNLTFAPIGTTTADVTSYADTTALSATQYYYRVIASNSTGDSPTSNVAAVTTPQIAPAAPGNLTAVAGSSTQINLAWSDHSANEDGFRVERSIDNVNFTQIGANLAASTTSYSDQAVVAGQTYYYRVTAFNIAGSSGYSNVASATVPSVPITPAPSWTDGDIGAVGAAGSSSVSGGTFTVTGSGADIYGSADAFHFVYRQLTGDGAMIVRVTSLQNTDANAKAGIVFRDSLAANAKSAMVAVTPSNGIKFLTRSSTGGSTVSTTAAGLKAPYWLKLVRSGNTFTSYRSADGANWTLVGSQTIGMGSTIYIGLGVTSHKAGALATATFDSLSLL